MAYELFLKLYDRAGDIKRAYIPPIWARYSDIVNGAGPVVFALNADSDYAANIAEFDIVEVFIRNKDLLLMDSDGGFVSAYVGIVRDWDLSTDDNGLSALEFTAPGVNSILSWRAILYYANVLNRSRFDDTAAESIMKALVKYNCTSDASIVNGRQREGDLGPGMGVDLSIAADGGAGNIISATFKGSNLLSALQKIAEQGGGDFALSWLGSNDYQFDFYPGQLGTDKSSGAGRVLFALSNATMANPRLRRFGAGATVAIAAGQGQEDAREISSAYGPDYALDYDLEIFVDARNEKTDAGRVYRGGLKLDEQRIKEELTFSVAQTGNQFYSPIDITGRKTYKPGDLALTVYGTEEIRKITGIDVFWRYPGTEDAFLVDVTTREVVFYGS